MARGVLGFRPQESIDGMTSRTTAQSGSPKVGTLLNHEHGVEGFRGLAMGVFFEVQWNGLYDHPASASLHQVKQHRSIGV